MASKQKSIFDKEPVKVRPQKHQPKTEDVVPFEDSIFALNKKDKVAVHSEPLVLKDDFVSIEDTIFCQRSVCQEDNDREDEDTKFVVHDDEIPFEESIFAKHKKRVTTVSNIPFMECKIDLEKLFDKYKDIYMNDYILNVKRLNMIDANTFNTCCINLEESRKTKVMNINTTYDLIKRIIKSVCTCTEDVFCCYTNMNRALFDLISELNPGMDTFTMYHILDRSYAEVIDEIGGKAWQKS